MSEKRIILHIGHTKTGSSALQSFLDANTDYLKEQNAMYYQPLYRYDNNPGKPNAGFLDGKDKSVKYLDPDNNIDDMLEREKKALQQALLETDTLILSDETLFSKIKKYEMFQSFLESLDENVSIDIVVYLREQTSWYLSAWKQYVKGSGGVLSYRRWIKWHKHLSDYYAMIKKLEKIYGKEHIFPRIYHRDSFYEGNLFSDFIHTIGLRWDERMNAKSDIHTNESIVYSVAQKKRFLNIFARFLADPIKERWDRIIWRWAIRASKGKKENLVHPGLSEEEIQTLKKEFEESNKKLAQEYFNKESLF